MHCVLVYWLAKYNVGSQAPGKKKQGNFKISQKSSCKNSEGVKINCFVKL